MKILLEHDSQAQIWISSTEDILTQGNTPQEALERLILLAEIEANPNGIDWREYSQ